MNFSLSEEQEMLKASVADFVKRKDSLRRVRQLREDSLGFSMETWKEMADMGWLGVIFPEEYGGLGLGMVEMAMVMEELGAGLMPEPMLSSVLMGGASLLFLGTEEQKKAHLPKVVDGELLLSLAHLEQQGRFHPYAVETQAELKGGKYVLRGEKFFVPDAKAADKIVVSARISGNFGEKEGVGWFLVDSKAKGVSFKQLSSMDWRKQYILCLEGVEVGEEDRLLGGENPPANFDKALSWATLGLSAEMLGGMNQAFNMTIDYLKTRKQFGVHIGSFQALKHRAADQYTQVELARSAVYYAAMALDEDIPEALLAVSTAKCKCNDAYSLIGEEAVQMHGGIGMTDEHDIGFFFKRSRVSRVLLGDSDHHKACYARLKEF